MSKEITRDELYKNVAARIGITPKELTKMAGSSIMRVEDGNFYASFLNSEAGSDLMDRFASREPQTFIGMVAQIRQCKHNRVEITYIDQYGYTIVLFRDKNMFMGLANTGLEVGSIIGISTKRNGGNQVIEAVKVYDLQKDEYVNFALRLISNYYLNDLNS